MVIQAQASYLIRYLDSYDITGCRREGIQTYYTPWIISVNISSYSNILSRVTIDYFSKRKLWCVDML
jgi:hypothetical protein